MFIIVSISVSAASEMNTHSGHLFIILISTHDSDTLATVYEFQVGISPAYDIF